MHSTTVYCKRVAPCYESGMGKRKAPSGTDGFEQRLAGVIEKLSPGRLGFTKARTVVNEACRYDVEIDTRGSKISFVVESLTEGLDVVTDALESGEEDPIRPAWRNLSRFQRELVRRTVAELAEKHMALAAAAKVRRDASAYAEFEIADAFHAAVQELDFEEVDARGMLIPTDERLEAEPVKVTQPRMRPA